MDTDDKFHRISTFIQVSVQKMRFTGSGFFYHQIGSKSKQFPDGKIIGAWIVTNRHVILPRIGGKEFVPDYLIFNLRKKKNNSLVWDPVKLNKKELLKRARFHSDKNVDVCIINVLDILEKKRKNKQSIQVHSVFEENIPEYVDQQIKVGVSDDVSIIGYPHGFYDEFNVFPIVKSGTIASKWGANFNGHPYFLIDAKLFPGSSGSIVVSKPKDLMAEGGKVLTAKEKQFAFLGIFSGEPFHKQTPIESDEMTIIIKTKYDVGIVWYGRLVEEIIKKGVSLTK